MFMNPPYGKQIGRWVEHLGTEYAEGCTVEAVALVPARNDTRWFKTMAPFPPGGVQWESGAHPLISTSSCRFYEEAEYQRQRRQLNLELESLTVPEADAAQKAGNLIEQLPELWEGASPTEQRQILMTMLDAVYVDAKEERRIVALKPKPAFRALFQIATTKEGSGVILYNDKAPTLSGSPNESVPCS